MELIAGDKKFLPHTKNTPGAYEWWHFDFIDDNNEYSIVIKFLTGNIYSSDYNLAAKDNLKGESSLAQMPLDHCAISVNIYYGQRIFYTSMFHFEKSEFIFFDNESTCGIRIGNSSIEYDENTGNYKIDVNYSYDRYGRKIRIEADFNSAHKPDKAELGKIESNDDKHCRIPSLCAFDVHLKIVNYKNGRRLKTELNGLGYAEHCWGHELLHSNISELHWGRALTNEHCLLYSYRKFANKSEPVQCDFILTESGKVVKNISNAVAKFSRVRNYWMLGFPGKVIANTEGLDLNCVLNRLVENSHSQIRALSDFSIVYNGKKILDSVRGISEHINLSRLRNPLFKNLTGPKIIKVT